MRKMFFACLAIFMSFSAFSTNKIITRTTKGGGPDGFDETTYFEDGTNIKIDCKGAGNSSCPDVPSVQPSGVGVSYALSEIAKGFLNGNTTIQDSNGDNFLVKWKSENISGLDALITVQPVLD